MARSFQRRAAEKHHPRIARCANGDAVAGTEDQQPRSFESVACDLDLAIHQIDRALFMVGVVLFLISLLINWLAQKIVRRYRISIG